MQTRWCAWTITLRRARISRNALKLVDSLLIQAVLTGASDIHLEPQENNLRIRLRIDGDLSEIAFLPQQAALTIVSRLKILCGLDISEKRLPQDGRLTATIDNRKVSFRASTIPSIYGEKMVLRVLDQKRSLLSVDKLGLNGSSRRSFDRLLQSPHGLILVTGPTGSGKTSTLYAIMDQLNSPTKNIMTLEDPVEYSLPGIIQTQIDTRAGLTFASGLPSVLRSDPNIIMVGEIRDAETAHLAVQAALTGHLVLTTLHTTSAVGTVTRLTDLGIDPFSLASSLIGVVSQRLVRLLCPACREAYILQGAAAQKLGLTMEPSQFFYRNTGCHQCRRTGYRGRLAIQEVLEIDSEIKNRIEQGAVEQETAAAARNAGMMTLKEDGFDKARQGLTTIEEVLRTV
jgi:type IV pilus assembly protein PilB